MNTIVSEIKPDKKTAGVIRRAVAILRNGGLVVFPTETVYGLAADPGKKEALRRICRVKGRAARKAIAFQVDTPERAMRLVRANPRFRALGTRFWPGPMTLVAVARGGNKKIGIRVPRHRFASALLRALGTPLAVTSANPSGGTLAGNAGLMDFFKDKVEMIVLDGRKRAGTGASTVVDTTGSEAAVLRCGPISEKEIQRVLAAVEKTGVA